MSATAVGVLSVRISDNRTAGDGDVHGVRRSARYYRVLTEVYEAGPHGVGAAEFDELAREHGYDRRGLNGCFAGMRAPLRLSDGRVRLTLAGQSAVIEHLYAQAAE